MPTSLELIDKVTAHLLAQGARCESTDEVPYIKPSGERYVGCLYRNEGKMCAVGCLIPEDKYSPALEGQVFHQFSNEFVAALGLEEHTILLNRLQNIHDTVPVWQWKDKLENLRRGYL